MNNRPLPFQNTVYIVIKTMQIYRSSIVDCYKFTRLSIAIHSSGLAGRSVRSPGLWKVGPTYAVHCLCGRPTGSSGPLWFESWYNEIAVMMMMILGWSCCWLLRPLLLLLIWYLLLLPAVVLYLLLLLVLYLLLLLARRPPCCWSHCELKWTLPCVAV